MAPGLDLCPGKAEIGRMWTTRGARFSRTNCAAVLSALALLALAAAAGCASNPRIGEPGPGGRPTSSSASGGTIALRTYGSLQFLMDQGQTRPVVSLASLRADKTLVGLGSLSALRGEIAIIPNEIWVAYPNDDGGTSRANELGAGDETAAFLVTASVPNWQTVPLEEDTSFDKLPEALEAIGRSAGLNVDRPFPFLIEGSLANLSFNVVDGRPFQGATRFDREQLSVASPKRKYDAIVGTVVGFFGKDEYREFLHPGTRLHAHVVLRSERQMGHVDSVDLPRGATFRVPAP